MITMRLSLAAAVAIGLVIVPAAGAEDAAKPAISKQKTNRTAKAHKKMPRTSGQPAIIKTSDSPLGYPYTMQKDEMTR